MPELPKIRCPECGRNMPPVTAREIPPADNYAGCLRRCSKCRIGATNAKNPAKVKFIRDVTPPAPQEPRPPRQEPQPPQTPQA